MNPQRADRGCAVAESPEDDVAMHRARPEARVGLTDRGGERDAVVRAGVIGLLGALDQIA